jgi:hypothetical protein
MTRQKVVELHDNREAYTAEIEVKEEARMTEQHGHSTRVGTEGLPYGTEAAEEMIADRIKKLEERGIPGILATRQNAINQLAEEGNLRTLRESTTGVYLGDEARRELAADRRRAAKQEQDDLDAAKQEAKDRGITLSELMNERVMRGEVKL